MPNNSAGRGTVYIPTGNPDTINYTPNYAPGELGTPFVAGQKGYQLVQLDSGATAATSVGVVAANQAAYWKDKSAYLVTNDAKQALGGAATNSFVNEIAGVFRSAVTAGNITAILQSGTALVKDGGNTFAVGQTVVGEADSTAAAFDSVAVGTASTYNRVGTARGAATGGFVSVDLVIPSIP